MIVFVINTEDRVCFPPSGLRVSAHQTLRQLAEEVCYFFAEVEGQTHDQLDALSAMLDSDSPLPTDESLRDAIVRVVRSCAGGRAWSIMDDDFGYIDSLSTEDVRDSVS